jgi:prefoldin subunit 5
VSEQITTIDINRADLKALVALPGIGEGLAKRIISHRPFISADDLLRVPGIGEKAVERLKPYLAFASENGAAQTPGAPSTGRSPAPSVGVAGRQGTSLTGKGSHGVSRETLLWICLGTGLVSVILAVILTLAILAGINGSLSVEQNESVRELNRRANIADTRLDEIGSSIDSIENRLQAVEGLSGRMTALEQEFNAVLEQIDAARAELDGIRSTVSTLSEQVGSLESRVSTFDAFLRGVQRILQEILPDQPMEVAP